MSEGGDQEEGGTSYLPDVLDDAEACKEINQDDLLSRVRSVFRLYMLRRDMQLYYIYIY